MLHGRLRLFSYLSRNADQNQMPNVSDVIEILSIFAVEGNAYSLEVEELGEIRSTHEARFRS